MQERDRIYSKVRGLLAKAESSEFPDEAATYTAKAQELIAMHAIDLALIETREGRGRIVTRVIEVPSPYPKEKFILLGGVAQANNCRAILGLERETFLQMVEELSDYEGEFASVVGYESDLEAVELLFASLLVQAVNEMLAHGSQVTEWGENRTKSFRRSFLYQYGCTVFKRLIETRDHARTEAASTSGDSLLPVLVSREEAVEAEVAERFPGTTTLRNSVSNLDGVIAGKAAGKRADIGSTRLRARPSSLPR